MSSVISTPQMSSEFQPYARQRHYNEFAGLRHRGCPFQAHDLDGAVHWVRAPAPDPQLAGDGAARAAEVHTLDPTGHDHSTAHVAHVTIVARGRAD